MVATSDFLCFSQPDGCPMLTYDDGADPERFEGIDPQVHAHLCRKHSNMN